MKKSTATKGKAKKLNKDKAKIENKSTQPTNANNPVANNPVANNSVANNPVANNPVANNPKKTKTKKAKSPNALTKKAKSKSPQINSFTPYNFEEAYRAMGIGMTRAQFKKLI